MRIEFSRHLRGMDQLSRYAKEDYTQRHGFFGHHSYDNKLLGGDVICLKRDYEGLVRDSVRAIREQLERGGFKVAGDGAGLYSSSPISFSLTAKASVEFDRVERERFERVGERRKLLRTIPVFREIPHMSVSGRISLGEQDVDPTTLLDLLVKLGYSTNIVTTQEEQTDSAMAAGASCDSGGRYSRWGWDSETIESHFGL